jgi:hypothetical protein
LAVSGPETRQLAHYCSKKDQLPATSGRGGLAPRGNPAEQVEKFASTEIYRQMTPVGDASGRMDRNFTPAKQVLVQLFLQDLDQHLKAL